MSKVALFLFAALVMVAGCSDKPSTAVGGGGAKNLPNISGKWKGKIEMPESSKDDPMAKMGEAFASLFLGTISLEFADPDKFTLSMMGMPIEGKVTRSGNELTLKAETAMGMTMEEAKKMNPKASSAPMDEEMLATISADGKEIRIRGKKDQASKGEMVFVRDDTVEKKVEKETVSSEERALVGEYGAEIHEKPKEELKGEAASEMKMAEAMLTSSRLVLRADNTYSMRMMLEFEGTWKLADGQIVLKMLKAMGMPEGAKASGDNEDLKLRLVEGGKKLVIDQPGPGGSKMAFVKK